MPIAKDESPDVLHPDDAPETLQADAPKEPGFLDRADAAIQGVLAPNPKNYESAADTNLIEVPKTLGREVYAAGKGALGVISPMTYWHAFTDPANAQELKAVGNHDPNSFVNKAGLGFLRLGPEPLGNLIADVVTTKKSVEEKLNAAPEQIGGLAGAVVAGKSLETAGSKALGTIRTPKVVGNEYIPEEIRTAPKPEVSAERSPLGRVAYPEAPTESPKAAGYVSNAYVPESDEVIPEAKSRQELRGVAYPEAEPVRVTAKAAPGPEPIPTGASALGEIKSTGARSAAETGEVLGSIRTNRPITPEVVEEAKGAKATKAAEQAIPEFSEEDAAEVEGRVRNSIDIGPESLDKVKDIIAKRAEGPVRYLNSGTEGVVFDIGGNKVARVASGEPYAVPNIPEVLQPERVETVTSSTGKKYNVSISPKVSTEGISAADVKQMKEALAAKGYHLKDAAEYNLGRTKDGKLVVLDPGSVMTAEEFGEHVADDVQHRAIALGEPTESSGLTSTQQRGMEHRLGKDVSAKLLRTPQGVEVAQRLLKGTNQQFADIANEHGPFKPGDVNAKWEASDFKRSGKMLSGAKARVIQHLVDKVSPEELLKSTEHWNQNKPRGPLPAEVINEEQPTGPLSERIRQRLPGFGHIAVG